MLPNHSSSLNNRRTQGQAHKDNRVEKSSSNNTEDVDHSGLFHVTTVGACLIKTLNTLVEEEGLSKEGAQRILDHFDKAVVDNFQTQMSSHNQSDTEITADTLNYNCSRSDWRIDATNVTIEMGVETIHVEDGRFLFRTDDKEGK